MALRTRHGGEVFIWSGTKNLLYKDYGYVPHYFYNPFIRNGIVIHPWEVLIAHSGLSRYFFSAYESGRIIEIDKDPRFSLTYKLHFDNKPWIECYFHGLDKLNSFVCDIEKYILPPGAVEKK